MCILKVEKRNENVKAKKLRNAGLVPGCVYGKEFEDSLLIQISQKDVRQLLKSKPKGSKVTLKYDDKEIDALLKDVSYCLIKEQVEHLGFQQVER